MSEITMKIIFVLSAAVLGGFVSNAIADDPTMLNAQMDEITAGSTCGPDIESAPVSKNLDDEPATSIIKLRDGAEVRFYALCS